MNNFSSKTDFLDYLYNLPKLHKKNDLSYIKRLLKQLGNPQNKVKTIHVTGTNGKGSTSYYLSALLQKAGQKTGLFVSPYVNEVNERIQLNNQNISDEAFLKIGNYIYQTILEIKQIDQDFSVVTFEFEVAMAFEYFAMQHCDYAVIEVGIGGTHDKTNVIDPQVSIITSIGLDHEQIIGPTIADIAREKSGIIKEKRSVVLGKISDDVVTIFEKKAKQKNAPIFQLGKDFKVKVINQKLQYKDKTHVLVFNARPVVENYDIAMAVCTFFLLHISLPTIAIEETINNVNIPGRYQIVQQKPLIIADGAHNIPAIKNLMSYVHQIAKGEVYLLVGMMKDKDIKEEFDIFKKYGYKNIYLTSVKMPRAAKLDDFINVLGKMYTYVPNGRKAFEKIRKKLGKDDMLVITGSFYLVSEILNGGPYEN